MKTLRSLANELAGKLAGSAHGDSMVSRVSSFRKAGADAAVFIERADLLAEAKRCGAGVILAPASAEDAEAPLLLVDDPRLAFAQAARLLGVKRTVAGRHETALVSAEARLGRDVSLGAHASVGAAVIGENSSIGAGSVIADGVSIGRDCVVHANVSIYAGVTIGDRVVVHAGAVLGADGFGYVRDRKTGAYLPFPQQGTLVIEDDVEIGANTTIDRGALEETVIGSGTKIDNLVHIGHNVQIGRNVVIAAQTGVSGSSRIGDGAIVGGQVGIADHVAIGEGVVLGAQAGIPSQKKLKGPGTVFWGTPARPIKQYLKELAILARMSRDRRE